MNSFHLIASFYWNPQREAFTVPFFNHPIYWYGILFVIGWVIAYFVANPIFTKFLIDTRQLSSLDILNWSTLTATIRTSSSPIITQLLSQMNPAICQSIQQKAEPTEETKQGILNGLNHLLKDSSISRDNLKELFGSSLAPPSQTAYYLIDRLCWFAVVGTIIGARLGAVFFYDWPYFREHPIEIFKVWHGGLASHGGFLGVIISLFLYLKFIHRWIPQLSFLRLLDYVAIPTMIVCFFIRLGNFVNQEILGTPTTMPWGIIFGNPDNGSLPIPRHPVQLYEGLVYLSIFFILWTLWKKGLDQRPGALIGLTFLLGFGSRFILEFWKSTQESILDVSFLQMGQFLSIPFILIGAILVYRAFHTHSACFHKCSNTF